MDNYHRRYHSQHVKLKDSCDSCSASKVRCTKEKPTCTRCTKLEHDCYYSPARRIGRPNRTFSSDRDSTPSSIARYERAGGRRPSFGSYTFKDIGILLDSSSTLSRTIRQPTQVIEGSGNPCPTNCFSLMLNLMLDLLSQLGDMRVPDPVLKLDASLNSAVKALSRVLICPCSQSLDVALLAAASCNCVLDFVDGLIRLQHNNYSPIGTPNSSSNTVMNELRRVANLVVQFGSRYQAAIDEEHRETLLGLAGDLKARLQATIEDATNIMELSNGV
ncbi:hypothetical protein GE09DRAFT_730862 [Coniochaeta sp. 2T2.1]|nr:hypothetical protein GE09DRAFT_730862 [Coniochaeta sp. 2T2.1]